MPIDRTPQPGKKQGGPPATVLPSTRVTVAFPFSTIKIHETDERMHQLATIVAELADHLAALDPSSAAQELQERAHDCATQLAS